MIPTHLDIGAFGYALILEPEIPNAFFKKHAHHTSAWCTYGPRELDGFVCESCKIVCVRTT